MTPMWLLSAAVIVLAVAVTLNGLTLIMMIRANRRRP